MPGTLVKDALAPKLLDAENVSASGNGASIDLGGPMLEVRIELVVAGTVTGTTPTLDVEIQSSDSSTFASGVVSHGRFKQLAAADASSAATHFLQAFVPKRYVRAVKTVGGTSPVFNAVSAIVRTDDYHRTVEDSA